MFLSALECLISPLPCLVPPRLKLNSYLQGIQYCKSFNYLLLINKIIVIINHGFYFHLTALLQDVTNLSQLPCLESLSLKDPVYGPNPVALLCNYSTHLLFHLPHLQRVDSYSVDNKTLKDLAEVYGGLAII